MSSTDVSRLPVAVRVYTEQAKRPANQRPTRRYQRPELLFVFDTETETDPAQALTFGSARLYRRKRGAWVPLREWLFHAEDLDAERLQVLIDYASAHGLPLLSQRAFLDGPFWQNAYKGRALVAGFNLPFDLSHLAFQAGEARGDQFGGGFSFVLWERVNPLTGKWEPNEHRPRVAVKTIDSKRHLIGLTGRLQADSEDRIPDGSLTGEPESGYVFRGHFLDCRTLAFALTNESHSLKSACEAFGVKQGKLAVETHGVVTPEYIDYNRRDVEATFELTVKLLEEYDAHPISPAQADNDAPLQETKAYSPASIGKAYLRRMGIRPRLELQTDFPPEVLAAAMWCFYGGRAECRIRRAWVPVVHLDFTSMYPTVDSLMGLWEMLVAERVEVVEETEATREFVEGVTFEALFDPAIWERFPVLVEVQPDSDVLPVRAAYEWDGEGEPGGWQIGVNPLTSDRPMWYALPDVLASKVLTGKAPKVLRAVRLVPTGRQTGLRPIKLRGTIAVDPGAPGADFFRSVIEERQRVKRRKDLRENERKRLDAFLKVLANATSYGIFAEVVRHELGKREREPVTVYGLDGPFTHTPPALEKPGQYFFAPVAACITAAARLMLALLERSVSDLGGTYAFCDTDSMSIVATEHGGALTFEGTGKDGQAVRQSLKVLSWEQVEALRHGFEALNPYDPEAVPGSVLKIEDVNLDPAGQQRQVYCYPISAKRYTFATKGQDGSFVIAALPAKESATDQEEETGERRAVYGKKTWSEHGLGHLVNPLDPESEERDWIRRCWELTVAGETLEDREPWQRRAAVSRLTVSSPSVLKGFASYNDGRPYARQVKPFNFMVAAHVAPMGCPPGADPAQFQLIAPYTTDLRRFHSLPSWFDKYTGERYRVATTGEPSSGKAIVKRYGDVLREYGSHPEGKSLGPDGERCTRASAGELRRRPVHLTGARYIGKEANKLEDRLAKQVHDEGEVLNTYTDPLLPPNVCAALKERYTRRVLAGTFGVSERTIVRWWNRQAAPTATRPKQLEALAHGGSDGIEQSGDIDGEGLGNLRKAANG